jgi:D-alanyl-lipoteichoic acid acyltransferase DltB (MBOAT superfamily)
VLFNSFEYLLFLPIVFLLYWFVFYKKPAWQNLLILCASYFFYGWWSSKFLGLLVFGTILDYTFGFGVASQNPKKAKFFLWFSIINNLGILGFFKYYNFFAIQVREGLGLLGLHTNPFLLQIALPLGISFYTFHGLSYIFDIYRGKQKPVSNFIDYAVFISFFPLLVAGPIERAGHLLPQVQKARRFSYTQAVEGSRLLLWGLFKKIAIADSLARSVDLIFSNYHSYNALTLILGSIAFSFQIYADFSGYSDIAIGTAKMMGFELFSNFRFPYFSRDIAEFWRRWHISLTSWFRDYLYIPLGGSREGWFKAVRNVMIVFLVCGFWHGASWHYIAWGMINSLGFLPILLLRRNRLHVGEVVAYDRKLPNLKELVKMFATFTFITFAFVFFRARSIGIALGYLKHIAVSAIHQPGQLLSLPDLAITLAYICPLVMADWWLRNDERILRTPKNRIIRYAVYFILTIAIFYSFTFNTNEQFIYFQF